MSALRMGPSRQAALLAAGTLLAAGCGGSSSQETVDPAVVERGAALYEASCVECHGGATGGSISDIAPPHNAEGHTWHHPDCQLTETILDGPPPRPGVSDDFPAMPAFRGDLTEEDVSAILAYIKTWWTDEQRDTQADITDTQCVGG